MSALSKDVEDFNNRDALNVQAPDKPFDIPVAYVSVQNESGTRWEPGNLLCASQTSHPKCPVCDCELTFLPPDTTFEVNFDNKTHIKHASTNDHSNNWWHPEEPLWNCLPKLDLEALYTNHLRGQKTKSGPVEKFLDYTLRKAAELIPLLKPSGTCWLLHWTFARHVLLVHLSAAQHMTNDPLMFIKRCTNEHAPRTWNSDWHDWIRETARNYLQCLIEIVIAQDIPDVKWASMTSIP